MNKSELISAMAAESQMSKADAKKALDAFINSAVSYTHLDVYKRQTE